MDAVSGLLQGPRACEAFLLRSTLAPPWAVRVEDEAPLTLVAVVRGSAWLLPDTGDDRLLGPGDTAIVCGPAAYALADAPGTPPDVVILPGQRCAARDGSDVTPMVSTGVRTWGNAADGPTVLLTGTYQLQGEISSRLLAALPPLLVVPATGDPLLAVLAEQLDRDEPGQQALLDRLLDVLLIGVLRAWFARPEAQPPRWYLAHGDPVVGPALRLLHDDPARPWTVASLAAATGISRAALARRFSELVGEPPMTYLTAWRLALAADLLCEPGSTVASVARQVGYGSAFALSAAFQRVRGERPSAYRAGRLPA